jgi:hypothetical protein
VEGSQGFALDIKFTRGRMQHPDNTLDTVQTLGTLSPSVEQTWSIGVRSRDIASDASSNCHIGRHLCDIASDASSNCHIGRHLCDIASDASSNRHTGRYLCGTCQACWMRG